MLMPITAGYNSVKIYGKGLLHYGRDAPANLAGGDSTGKGNLKNSMQLKMELNGWVKNTNTSDEDPAACTPETVPLYEAYTDGTYMSYLDTISISKSIIINVYTASGTYLYSPDASDVTGTVCQLPL